MKGITFMKMFCFICMLESFCVGFSSKHEEHHKLKLAVGNIEPD